MIRMAGAAGTLVVAGRAAVALGAWHARGEAGGWLIEGHVARVDAYWSAFVAAGCTAVLRIADVTYRWRGAVAALDGETVSVVAQGQPEISKEEETGGQT